MQHLRAQIPAERVRCTEVTMAGDRGILKTIQIERLPEGFYYTDYIRFFAIFKLPFLLGFASLNSTGVFPIFCNRS